MGYQSVRPPGGAVVRAFRRNSKSKAKKRGGVNPARLLPYFPLFPAHRPDEPHPAVDPDRYPFRLCLSLSTEPILRLWTTTATRKNPRWPLAYIFTTCKSASFSMSYGPKIVAKTSSSAFFQALLTPRVSKCLHASELFWKTVTAGVNPYADGIGTTGSWEAAPYLYR